MPNSIDPAFDTWLRALPALGYERDWVGRNLPMLRRVYDQTGGAPMKPCPPPTRKAQDRYAELD